jgi:urease accessory protein
MTGVVVSAVLGRLDAGDKPIEADEVKLTAEERVRGHQRVVSSGGRELLLSLPRGYELTPGDVLAREGDVVVVVRPAVEDVLEIRPRGSRQWALAGYVLGNLHRSVRRDGSCMLVLYEAPVEEVMAGVGLEATRLRRALVGERLGTARTELHGHTDGHGL